MTTKKKTTPSMIKSDWAISDSFENFWGYEGLNEAEILLAARGMLMDDGGPLTIYRKFKIADVKSEFIFK